MLTLEYNARRARSAGVSVRQRRPRRSAVIEEFKRRHVPFGRWFNVRDLGGYAGEAGPVTWRRYYRAGAPTHLDDDDIERARGLGIRSVIDLRREDEGQRTRPHPIAELGATYHLLPVIREEAAQDLLPGARISSELYLNFLDVGGDSFRTIFEVLGNPDSYPVVVHCSAGKDRTGVVSAMALEILGVPRETIEADYAMTNLERERAWAFWQERGGWFATATPDQLDFALSVPPEAISGFLDGLQARYGGAEGYLRGVGVPAEAFRGLRRALGEPS